MYKRQVLALVLALAPRFRALGVAAATGLAALAASAVVYHLVNNDPFGDIAPAIIQGGIAASYAALSSKELEPTLGLLLRRSNQDAAA